MSSFKTEVVSMSASSLERPVEVRYSLKGKSVLFSKNVIALFNEERAKRGIKPVKENIVFQYVFDQAINSLVAPIFCIEIPFENSEDGCWRLSLEGFESIDHFNAAFEDHEAGRSKASKSKEAGSEGKQDDQDGESGSKDPEAGDEPDALDILLGKNV